MADRTLQIERVRISDEGVYVCRVENSVGWREAEARLVVHCTMRSFLAFISLYTTHTTLLDYPCIERKGSVCSAGKSSSA